MLIERARARFTFSPSRAHTTDAYLRVRVYEWMATRGPATILSCRGENEGLPDFPALVCARYAGNKGIVPPPTRGGRKDREKESKRPRHVRSQLNGFNESWRGERRQRNKARVTVRKDAIVWAFDRGFEKLARWSLGVFDCGKYVRFEARENTRNKTLFGWTKHLILMIIWYGEDNSMTYNTSNNFVM